MELNNTTAFQATALPMMGPGDQSMLTMIVKATFTFSMGKTEPAVDQAPIAFGDTFYEDLQGQVHYETDMSPFKPRTDVVLSGTAYAPEGKPSASVDVGLRVGPVQKNLKIIGRRLWNHAGVLSRRFVPTHAEPFVSRPIRYTDAFGGMDENSGEYCAENLSGKGYYSIKTKTNLAGQPLPNIEDPNHLIQSPKDHPTPVGFGFYHRAWHPRATYAGTYDNTWHIERRPWYPKNFNFRFYNGAHPDLQAEGYLQGNEPVKLVNLTPEGTVEFDLPGIVPQCRARRVATNTTEPIPINLDTVFIESDQHTFCLVWRGSIPLAELSEAEIEQVTVDI
jgi:hypothetical protein